MPGPSFNQTYFDKFQIGTQAAAEGRMSLAGTVNKALILLGLALLSGSVAWSLTLNNEPIALKLVVVGLIGSLVFAFLASFKPQTAVVTAPLYALFEGLVLGAISSVFDAKYRGIVFSAVVITLAILLLMLAAYKTKLIRATPMFAKGLFAATGCVALLYVVQIVAGLFGAHDVLGLNSSGPLGIGVSVVIIAVASLNFIMDFSMIERNVESGQPKFMEWYSAFGVMVTLFWLYLEVLRLLMKLQSNNRN